LGKQTAQGGLGDTRAVLAPPSNLYLWWGPSTNHRFAGSGEHVRHLLHMGQVCARKRFTLLKCFDCKAEAICLRCVAYGCSFTNHFSSCFSLDIPSRVQIEGGEWRDSMFLGVRVPASPPFVRIASVAFLGRAVRPLCSRSSGKSFPGYNRDPQNHRAAHPQLRGQRQHACAHGQDSVDRVPERVLLLQH